MYAFMLVVTFFSSLVLFNYSGRLTSTYIYKRKVEKENSMKNAEDIWELINAGMLSLEEFKEWVDNVADVNYYEGRNHEYEGYRNND